MSRFFLLAGKDVVIGAQKAADVGMPSFLALMVQPSPSANISWAICLGVFLE